MEERLNPYPDDIYSYPTLPCDFATARRELELMAGVEVNLILMKAFDSHAVIRCWGRMSLPESGAWPGDLHFDLGEGIALELSEPDFTRAEYMPGCVWIEIGTFVLKIERRHLAEVSEPSEQPKAA